MKSLKNAQGGCMCGATRVELLQEPLFINACHCKDCQKQSGSAFAMNMWIEEDNIKVTGAPLKVVALIAGSGKKLETYACEKCGIVLWSKYYASTGLDIMVRMGILDEPQTVVPDAHIFLKDKQDWFEVPAQEKQFEAFYNLFQEWPEASINRFNKLISQAKAQSAEN